MKKEPVKDTFMEPFHQRFIEAVRHYMSVNDIGQAKAAAEDMGIAYQSLQKVMDGTYKPTIAYCITLCEAGDYSANWLFLGKGSMNMTEQNDLNAIKAELRSLKRAIKENVLR